MTAVNMIRNTLLATSILFAAAGCARREEDPLEQDSQAPTTEAGAPASTGTPQAAPAPSGAASDFVQGPKITAPIQVEIVPTPAAKAELLAKSETIIVEAVYGGDPTPTASSQVNEFGLVPLGRSEQTLPASGGKVGFSEEEIDRNRLGLIIGQPQVMFNVRSARKAVPKNLLSCELYWNSVQAASSGPIQIPCRLISEPAPARAPAPAAASPQPLTTAPSFNQAATPTSASLTHGATTDQGANAQPRGRSTDRMSPSRPPASVRNSNPTNRATQRQSAQVPANGGG